MPQVNLTPDDVFRFIQNFQLADIYKWILLILAFGFIIFHAVVFNQIRSLDKVISQPSSSGILSFISLAFVVSGIILSIIILLIPL